MVAQALDIHGNIMEVGDSGVVRTVKPANMKSPDVKQEMQWLQETETASAQSQGLLHVLISILRGRLSVFALGFVCAVGVVFVIRSCRMRSSRGSWLIKILPYARLPSRWPAYGGKLDRYHDGADHVELEPNDKYDQRMIMDEASEPLVK